MTDHTRLLQLLLPRAGLDISGPNRKLLDRAVRDVLGMQRYDGNDVDKAVETIIHSDKKQEFEQRVIEKLVEY